MFSIQQRSRKTLSEISQNPTWIKVGVKPLTIKYEPKQRLTLKKEKNSGRKLTGRADLKTKRRKRGLTGGSGQSGLWCKPKFEEPSVTPSDPNCAIKSTMKARTGFKVESLRVQISNRALK